LIPKEAKNTISATAAELNVDPEFVDNVVCFMWSEIRKVLSEVKHHRLRIPNLGTFEVVSAKVDKKIEKYEKQLIGTHGFTYYRAQRHDNCKIRLEKLKEIKVKLVEEYANKRIKRKLRGA